MLYKISALTLENQEQACVISGEYLVGARLFYSQGARISLSL